jgi:hypothetical protein
VGCVSKAPLIKPDEIEMVKQYVLLPVLLNYLEQDLATLKKLQLHLSLVVAANFNTVHHELLIETANLKKQLFKRGIKIVGQQQDEAGIHIKYLCRGWNHDMSLLWGFIKAQAVIKLSGELGIDLESSPI